MDSTEAAVIGTVLVHLPPIPGCETKNVRFFSQSGMSYYLNSFQKGITQALFLANDAEARANMIQSQSRIIHKNASAEICDLAQDMVYDVS